MIRTLFTMAAIAATGLALAQEPQARNRTELGADAPRGMMIQILQQAPSAPGVEVSLALPVNFEFGSARLTPEGMSILATTAEALNSAELIGQTFLVEGHTDTVGGDQANLALSQQRADAAKAYLESKGVAGVRLTAIGYGESRLIGGVAGTDARQRRVEIVREGG